MEQAIEKLLEQTKRELDTVRQEVNELSCETNPHPDDVVLCDKLTIKFECYQKFYNRLKTISNDHYNDL